MTNEEIEQIEISKENAKKTIAKGEALKRLLANPDYKEIISDGFFKDYATQLAIAIANNTGAYDAKALCKSLEGINVLKGYEFKIANNYEAALQDLVDLDNLIAESVKQADEE